MKTEAGIDCIGVNVYVGDVVQDFQHGNLYVVTGVSGSNVHLSVGGKTKIIYYEELKEYKLRGCGTNEDWERRAKEPCCIMNCEKTKVATAKRKCKYANLDPVEVTTVAHLNKIKKVMKDQSN